MANNIFKQRDVRLDTFIDKNVQAVTSFSQGDRTSAKLVIDLSNDGEKLDLTDATQVRIDFRKPDKKLVFQYCDIEDKPNGIVSVVLESQTLVVPGNVEAEVTVFYPGDKAAVTKKFSFHVNEAIAGEQSLESANVLPMLDKAIEAGEKLENVDIDGIIAAGAKADESLEVAEENANQIGILSGSINQQVVNVLDLGVDNTGTVDNTELFNTIVSVGKYNRLFFPKGTYLGTIYVGSDKEIIGVKPKFNPTTNKLEQGTILKSGIQGWGAKNVIIRNIGVDGATDGFKFTQGANDVNIYNCITNVNGHGFLIEELGTPISDVKIVDCTTHNGIHGFVSKAGTTQFVNCNAHKPTTNGFVMVSDNILGADKLSNCIDNDIVNCKVYGGGITPNGLFCYARDYSTTTGSLVKHENLSISNFRTYDCKKAIILGEIGLAANVLLNQSITNVTVADITTKGTTDTVLTLNKNYKLRVFGGTFTEAADKHLFIGSQSLFSEIVNVINFLPPDFIISDNNAAPAIFNCLGYIIKIRNTVATTINNFANSYPGKVITAIIDDDFSTINQNSSILSLSPITGKGKRITLRCNKDYKWEEVSRGV